MNGIGTRIERKRKGMEITNTKEEVYRKLLERKERVQKRE